MPTVDTINVEIRANLPVLNREMAQAERRVDTAAGRMAASVEKVTAKSEAKGSRGRRGVTGLLANTPNRLLGAFIGVGMLGGVARGFADAVRDGDTSWENINYRAMQHIPIMRDILGIYEAMYEKQYDITQLQAQMAQMDKRRESIKDFQSFIDSNLPQSRIDAATDPREKRRLMREKELDELDAEYQKRLAQANALWGRRSPQANPARLFEQVSKLNEWLTNSVTGVDQKFAEKAKAQFDSVSTVFGSMRVRQGGMQNKPANEATQKKQLDEQKKANGILSQIKQAIGKNGVWA